MPISSEQPRELPFPLQDSTAIVRAIPTTTPEPIEFTWETSDASEIVSIRLDLSQDEYTALASAVDVGSDIAYNKDAQYIWDIWTKAFRGAIETMTCEDVADCIETSTEVQDALTVVNQNTNDLYGTYNPDILTPAGTETEIMDTRFPPADRAQPAHELVDCNLDELWAGIYFMVQKLDETGRDWLEFAVSGADKSQRAANIVAKIPIIGSVAGTALEQLAEVAQDILNLYNAYSTEASQQDIACALFELVCAECRYPTFDEIADYYRSNSTITTENYAEITLKALVDFLFLSNLAAAQLCYHTVIMVALWTLYVGSTFVGMRGIKWISIWLDNGEEFANDEWQVLCDGCADEFWQNETDFEVDAGIFTFPYGRDSNGALFTDAGSFKQSIVSYIAPADNEILYLEVLMARTGGSGGINDSWAIRSNMNTNNTFPVGDTKYDQTALSNSEAWRCWRPSVGSAYRQFQLIARVQDNGAGSTIYIKAINIIQLNSATGFVSVASYPATCP